MSAAPRFLESRAGEHMDRLLLSLNAPSDLVHFDALALLVSAGNYLLTRAPDLDNDDWEAAMTLLWLYNSIDNGR